MPFFELDRLPSADRRRRPWDLLIWLPLNVLQVLSFVLVCAVLIPAALLVRTLTRSARPAMWMAHHWWAPIVVGGGLARLRVSGRESLRAGQAYLVVANHQSYFDIPVLCAALPPPLHFLADESIRAAPGFGHFGAAVGMIFLRKNSRLGAGRAVRELADYLRQGRTTVVFPEGTRSWDGEMRPFFPAMPAAAILAEAEILPVAIVNSRAVMPRGGGFLFRPATVEVRIGRPIPTRGFAVEDREALTRAAWEAVNELRGGAPVRSQPAVQPVAPARGDPI